MSQGDLNFDEFIKQIGWGNDKFYKNIEIICSSKGYGLNRDRFRKAGETKPDYCTDDKNYIFREQWIDLVYVLFTLFTENPFYRKKSSADNRSLEEIINYNRFSLKLIQQELTESHRREIMLHPAYAATLIETKAMKKVSEKFQLLLASVSNMPIESRASIWLSFDKIINQQLIQNYLSAIDTKEKIEEEKGDLFKNLLYGEYEHVSLDKLVAQVLEKEMDATHVKERDDLIKQYSEIQDELDRTNINISDDTPDVVKAINDLYKKSGMDALLSRSSDIRIDNEIRERLAEVAEMVDRNSSIDATIDETIEQLKRTDAKGKESMIEKMIEVQSIIKKNSKDLEKFSNIADKVLQELNFNILNRK